MKMGISANAMTLLTIGPQRDVSGGMKAESFKMIGYVSLRL
jgi:hypothetical protein